MGRKYVGGPGGIDPNDQGVRVHLPLSPLQFRQQLSWQRDNNAATMGTLSWQAASNVDRGSVRQP